MINIKNNFKINWFTLVELVIMITILAILWTIAFMSFWWYMKNSRDTARIQDINTIKNWFELYSINSNNYPSPDWSILSWSVNWKELTYVWILWDNLSRLLKINKNIKDPLTNTNYQYWVSSDYKYYQISEISETDISSLPFIKKAYADNEKAKVVWNYKWYLKYNSWSEIYVTNIPSLLFNNTWSVDLLSSWTYFVVDKKSNLPYNIKWLKDSSIQKIWWLQMIKDITKSNNATLTGINITWINENNIWTFFSWNTLESFNINWKDLSNTQDILNSLKNGIISGDSPTSSTWTNSQNSWTWVNPNRYPGCDTDNITLAWHTRAACNQWASFPNIAGPAYSCENCCTSWYHAADFQEWDDAINIPSFFTTLKLNISWKSRVLEWDCVEWIANSNLNDDWYEWESWYYIGWWGRIMTRDALLPEDIQPDTYWECFQLRCVKN
jgi:Tfp pilus assembly major pilin PilA